MMMVSIIIIYIFMITACGLLMRKAVVSHRNEEIGSVNSEKQSMTVS